MPDASNEMMRWAGRKKKKNITTGGTVEFPELEVGMTLVWETVVPWVVDVMLDVGVTEPVAAWVSLDAGEFVALAFGAVVVAEGARVLITTPLMGVPRQMPFTEQAWELASRKQKKMEISARENMFAFRSIEFDVEAEEWSLQQRAANHL